MHEVNMPEHSQQYTASRTYRQGNLKSGPSFCKHEGTGVRDGGGRRRVVFPQSNTDIVMVYTACQMLLLVMLMLS